MQPSITKKDLLTGSCCIALSLLLSFSFLLFSLSCPKRAHANPIAVGAGVALETAEFVALAAACAAVVAACSGLALGAGPVQDFGADWFTWYGKDSTAEDWTAEDWQAINTAHLCEVIGLEVTNSNGETPPDPDFEPNDDFDKLAKVIQGVLAVGAAGADDMVDAAPGVLDWLFGNGDNPAVVDSSYPVTVTMPNTGLSFQVDPFMSPDSYYDHQSRACPDGYVWVQFRYATSGSGWINHFEALRSDYLSRVSSVSTSNDYITLNFSEPVSLYYGADTFRSSSVRSFNVNAVGNSCPSVISIELAQFINASYSSIDSVNDSLPLLNDPESITGYIGSAISDIVGAVQTAQQYWQNLADSAGQVPEGETEPAPFKIIEPLQVPITNDIPYDDVVRDTDHDPTPDPGNDPVNPDPGPDPGSVPVPSPDDLVGPSGQLQSLFPFCLPHDLHYITSRLVASSSAPRFTWVFDFSAFGVGRHELVVDLNDYADIARIIRFMLLVSFLVGWILLLVRTKPWDIGT